MPIGCFRPGRRDSDAFDPEPVIRRSTSTFKTPKMATLRRTFTSNSTNTASTSTKTSTRTSSNASIAQLPPCPHLDDPKVEALMMPVPQNDRPSKCLRLSYPRIYSNLVTEMKDVKGCRDWRNFAVFDDNDVDMSVSAIEYARKTADNHRKKMSAFASF